VRQLGPGLWHWETLHPDWEASQPWQEVYGAEAPRVSSYAINDGDRLLLFDPLSVPSEIEELAADRDPVVVLTCPWHERDTQSLVERLGAPVFVPPPDEGTPDVAWLLGGDTAEGHLFSAGDRLPVAKAAVRSLPATRLSTSATASRSRSCGSPRA
jgi:hypothetical protein